MRVTICFYSYFKDLAGCARATETLPDGSTLDALFHKLMLRFPKRHLNADAVTAYCIGDSASLKAKGDRLILSFEADYEGCEWIEAEGWLDSMISLRSKISCTSFSVNVYTLQPFRCS